MAPSFMRTNAPAWPPFKDRYKKVGTADEIPLRSRVDLMSGSTINSALPTPYVPSPDVYNNISPRKLTKTERFGIQGWKGGARFAFYTASAVLFINVMVTIVLSAKMKWMDGMTMVYQGPCKTTEKLNAGIHLLINALSTCLLAASNYCMQLLSSPTRADIDKCHARGHWLDLGVPSLRNLRSLTKKKIFLWWILAISSIPLHLLYNSIFFSAIATNSYQVIYATPEFAFGAPYDTLQYPDVGLMNFTFLQSKAPRFTRMNRKECIETYGQDFLDDRKNVIVVVANVSSTTNSSILQVKTEIMPDAGLADYNPFSWICNDPKTISYTEGDVPCRDKIPALLEKADTWWRTGGYDVDYCLSQQFDADCHEHFAPTLMAPVLFFNIFKAIVIWYVAFRYQDKPLVTVGDAIESFIRYPDPTTQHMCLATHAQVSKHWTAGYVPQPQRFDVQPRRWFSAVSHRQWALFAFLFTLAMAGTMISIAFAVKGLTPSTLAYAWSLGMGNVRQQNIISGINIPSLGSNAIFLSAIIANAPQSVFSFIYLVYNTVFSTMFLGREWDSYATSAKGRYLRVSEPTGTQKSTYFLQIPYRYAAVMLTGSGLLHWLVSQSIFLANVQIVDLNGKKADRDEVISCAVSVKGMIFALVLCLVMLVWMLGNACRKYSGNMVMAGSNSAAISAACHVLGRNDQERDRMVFKRLKWGATDFGSAGMRKRKSVMSGDFSKSPGLYLNNTVTSPYEKAIYVTDEKDKNHTTISISEFGLSSDHRVTDTGYRGAELPAVTMSPTKTPKASRKKRTSVQSISSTGKTKKPPLSTSKALPPLPPTIKAGDTDSDDDNIVINSNTSINNDLLSPRQPFQQGAERTQNAIYDDDDKDLESAFENSRYYHINSAALPTPVPSIFGLEAAPVGHCSFSDGLVGKPVEGRLYA